MYSDYATNRKLEYSSGLRGDFVRFIQHIHDKVRVGEVEKLSSPISVYWELTQKCNLLCKHCYVADEVDGVHSDLSLTEVLVVIDALAKNGVMEVVLQGGEPFCYKYILEVIQELKNKGVAISLLTNGTLLTGENRRCINNCLNELDLVQVSLDGFKNKNDYIRGQGTFDEIIKNLNQLVVPNVVVNCVVTSENINDLPALCAYLNNNTNVSELHFSPLMRTGRGSFFNYPPIEKAMQIYSQLKQQSRIKISGSVIPDIWLLEHAEKYDIDMSAVKLGCCAGRSKMFIDHLGNVHSCDYRRCKSLFNSSLLTTDFQSIWATSWENQVKQSAVVSRNMAKTKIIEPFCPSLYSK